MVNENRAKVAKLSEEHKSHYIGEHPNEKYVQFKDNTRGEVELPVMLKDEE